MDKSNAVIMAIVLYGGMFLIVIGIWTMPMRKAFRVNHPHKWVILVISFIPFLWPVGLIWAYLLNPQDDVPPIIVHEYHRVHDAPAQEAIRAGGQDGARPDDYIIRR
jgi:hypothetical protein